MSILKYALLGAAVAYGINYMTKKRADGTSILDELTEKAPGWIEHGKNYAAKTIDDFNDKLKEQKTQSAGF